ncbi:MAG: HypC/HybG/HupF family hydrogenase formation chaperone [Planctomycetia bacterium]|nr:HypC/HybG/HupF family hydrogenase formation chaperone [Planctomycetia bacterium]
MCLAVPAKLIAQDGQEGIVDLHGNRMPVNTMMTPDAVPGDWLLIHAGFAIERLDADAARETWALLADVDRANVEVDGEVAETKSRNGGPLHSHGGAA